MGKLHRPMIRKLGLVAALLTAGCLESTAPPNGSIEVAVSTTGLFTDRDVDGYLISINDAPAVAIGTTGTITIGSLTAGTHKVLLHGLAANCSVNGVNPQSVEITDVGSAATPVFAVFNIVCEPRTGSVRITTTTIGSDLDPDGYTVFLKNPPATVLPANGTTTVTGVRLGRVLVSLQGVSRNCTVDGPLPRPVDVVFGTPAVVDLTIRCDPAGTLQITTSTRGVAVDSDGYGLQALRQGDGSPISVSLPANGTTILTALRAGSYQLTVQHWKANCDVAKPQFMNVLIAGGAAVPVAFDVNCAAPTQLAFVSTSGGNSEINVINSDSTNRAQLTFNPSTDINPAWSVNGKIAFASRRQNYVDIYVMDADGRNVVRITETESSESSPAWSPDGSRIAFVSDRDGNEEIYVMNADGSNVVRLTTNAASDGDPDWSPDGSRIAFRSKRSGNDEIHVMNADGTGEVRLTSNPLYPDGAPSWSPDGTLIAFSGGKTSTLRELRIMNADGSGMRAIPLPFSAEHIDPAWSPDGKKIAVETYRCDYYYYYDCGQAIQIISIDGALSSFHIFGAAEPAWRR